MYETPEIDETSEIYETPEIQKILGYTNVRVFLQKNNFVRYRLVYPKIFLISGVSSISRVSYGPTKRYFSFTLVCFNVISGVS